MSETVVEYTAVRSTNIETFAQQVNHKINEGWQPYGNPLSYKEDDTIRSVTFLQAMVKTSDKPTLDVSV